MSNSFRCLVVSENEQGFQRSIEQQPETALPPGDVRIRVEYSSLNFKDALAATGHPGVAGSYPHVPGIDAVGEVIESSDSLFAAGDAVIVTGRDLGVGRWGGWSEQIRVPGDWVLPLPEGLSARESMVLGTAGFTAAQCVSGLLHHGITPASGEILVTGATGGVGGLAVRLLSHLGYRVAASTGKESQHDRLRAWGAATVVSRDDVNNTSEKALLEGRWAGSVDTVGGNVLATTLRSLAYRGCVTACGLTAGAELVGTVYPFLLRGISLVGIDSAACPHGVRKEIWHKLANEWKLPFLEEESTTVGIDDLDPKIDEILDGRLVGRYVVQP